MKKLLLVGLVSTALIGCSAAMQPAKKVEIPYQFDVVQAKKQLEDGKETLKGNAFLRQMGGGIVNCAGSNVDLYPYSQYSDIRIQAQYPKDIWLGSRIKSRDTFTPDAAEFDSLKRTAICDSEGNFEFESIKDGNYILVTEVIWNVMDKFGPSRQGGYLIKNISVGKGQKSKVIITE